MLFPLLISSSSSQRECSFFRQLRDLILLELSLPSLDVAVFSNMDFLFLLGLGKEIS